MRVSILKNIKTEGPGTIENFLRNSDIHYKTVELENEALPGAGDFDALIILGGPMSVNDNGKYPYIREEEMLVGKSLAENKKILGICLGAQIIAKALGSKVYKGIKPEIGWHDIELTESAMRDCPMKKLAIHPQAGDFWKRFKVFHWHEETFDIPAGAERLAKSDLYQNQAFRYGANAYAFQFHIEVTKDMIYDWLRNENVDMDKIKAETETLYDVYNGRALNFYKAFFK